MKKISLLILVFLVLFSLPLFAKSKVRMGVLLDEKIEGKFGVRIKKITKESPAEEAGLMVDDIILKIDGDKIYTVDQIKKMLTFFEPEQKIKITYEREDKTKTCSLQLEEKKVPTRTYMGVFLEDLSENIKKELKYKGSYGILIQEVVEDSPADKAGLKGEDILLTFADEKIYTTDQLIKMLQNYKPENKVSLEILRGKKNKKIDIILGEKEDKLNYFFSNKDGAFTIGNSPENVLFYKYDLPGHNKWIGVELEMEKHKTTIDGDETVSKKTIIKKVVKDAPAYKAGLKDGDVVIAVESDKDMEIKEAIEEKKIGDKITLTVERDGKARDIVVTIGKRENYKSEKNIEVTIDDGDIKVLIDGVEKNMSDLENIQEGSNEIKMIKHITVDECDDSNNEMKKVKKEMKTIDIELLNTDDEL